MDSTPKIEILACSYVPWQLVVSLYTTSILPTVSNLHCLSFLPFSILPASIHTLSICRLFVAVAVVAAVVSKHQ